MTLIQDPNVTTRRSDVLSQSSLSISNNSPVIGRSGSGKSTPMRCVNGLEPIQGGSVTFDGAVINDPGTDLPELRQHR